MKTILIIILFIAVLGLPGSVYGQTNKELSTPSDPNNTTKVEQNEVKSEEIKAPATNTVEETQTNTEETKTSETNTVEETQTTTEETITPETNTVGETQTNTKENAEAQNTVNSEDNQKITGRAVIVDLTSDKLEYFQDEDTFVATGSAKVVIAEQNAELVADKVVYHQRDEYITAEGGLTIKKDGRIIKGDYARIDLNKESALISNPNTIVSKVKMNAKEATLYPEYIELKDGNAILEQNKVDVSLTSSEYEPQELRSQLPGRSTVVPVDPKNKKPNYRVVAKEIELDRAKTVNNLIIRNAKVYIGKIKVASIPRMTLTIGENSKAVEAMMPEVGFNKNIAGIYIGPSLTLDLPKGSCLRISPVVSALGRDSGIGGGGIVRFRSGINTTDVAYTTTANRLVVKGEQKLYKDTTKIKYLVNEYADQGFMGTGLYRPLYLAELVDERKIGEVLDHKIFTRLGGGIARDVNDGIATSRLQFQTSIISDKPLLKLKDYIALRLQSQFNFAYYGTGDTYTIVRGGPRVDWNIWRFNVTTAYFQAGVWGQTPFIFDKFIRGNCNLILAGDFRISKFLSIGNIRSLNLDKDNAEPLRTSENQFYARVGPEDFKFRIGYDLERKRSTFGLDLFLGSGRSALNFDKLKILHPEVGIE